MAKHHAPGMVKARRRRRLRRDGKKHLNNLQAFVLFHNNRLSAASTTLTASANPANGDTVTLGTKVYTFQTVLTNVDGNVKLGATAALTLQNLFCAVNLNGGVPGTDYAAAMTQHPTVYAETLTPTVIRVRAKTGGTAGNAIASTKTGTALAFGGATLSNGVASFDTRAKMKKYRFRSIKNAVLSTDLP